MDRSLYIAQVQAEMQAQMAAGHSYAYFRNFAMRLNEDTLERVTLNKLGFLDTLHKELITSRFPSSELYLNQTPRQFYEAIDHTIAELGLDKEDIRLITTIPSQQFLFYEKWAPRIFMKLIETGYTAEELLL